MTALAASSSWESFVGSQRHKSDLSDNVRQIPHPAAHFLDQLRKKGAPVVLKTPPWSKRQRRSAIQRGSHKSGKEHLPFLHQEFVDMIRKGHWILLPSEVVIALRDFHASPIGVVPQRDRRPRTISDYSFFDVNDETVPLVHSEAMQFGRTLHRLLAKIIAANPRFGPVYLSKLDISDGFYRIWLLAKDTLKLGVLFPKEEGVPDLVAFPLALPMGWVNSPPLFCAATETVADLANASLPQASQARSHRLEDVADTLPQPDNISPPTTVQATPTVVPLPPPRTHTKHDKAPLEYIDVYVDDFISLVQGSPLRRKQVQRVLLHTLDTVFRELEPGDNPHRQEPASVKKFKKGDGAWMTRKLVLGWLIDTISMTIELPPHRIARLHEILDSIKPGTRRVATKTWHQVLGELRSMVLAIPGGQGLFSTLQEAFRHPSQHDGRLELTRNVHDFLEDFRWLAQDLSNRPTRIHEVVQQDPSTLGTTDAAGRGMGGVHFIPSTPAGNHQSLLWRSEFHPAVQQSLVSYDNPQGTITNSDLELAGAIAHQDVLVHNVDVREHTIGLFHDNTPAVFWQRKGSTSTVGPAAYLLRLKALHQRFHRYVSRHDYLPGPANAMADDCSRLWHLTDSQLVAYFNSRYPQPSLWTLCHLRPQMRSALTSALFRKRSVPESFLDVPQPPITIGKGGWTIASPSTLTHGSMRSTTPSQSSRSLVHDTAMDGSLPVIGPSVLAQWKTPYVRWARRSPAWGPKTSAKTRSVGSIFGSNASSAPTPKRIPRRRG